MANWQERMEHVEEMERQKIVADRARIEAEARERQRQKEDEVAVILNKGHELTKVLDRINVQKMLREIGQQVWRVGEIRDSYTSDTHYKRGERRVGLYWDFEIEKLIPENYVDVKERYYSSGSSDEYGSSSGGWRVADVEIPTSLRRIRKKTTSALMVQGITLPAGSGDYNGGESTDKFHDRTYLRVYDVFGFTGIYELCSPIMIVNENYGTLFLGDDVTDSQVRIFIEDSFAKSCLYRTKNNLLPSQLKDRESEIHSEQEKRFQQNKKLIPWYKR